MHGRKVSEISDSTGAYPGKVSEISDSTGAYPGRVSEISDRPGACPGKVSEISDRPGGSTGACRKFQRASPDRSQGVAALASALISVARTSERRFPPLRLLHQRTTGAATKTDE